MVIRVRGRGSGRVSMAGMTCYGAGERSRLIYATRAHRGRKEEPKGFGWKDYRDLVIRARTQLGGPIVLVWDNLHMHLVALWRAFFGVTPTGSVRAACEGRTGVRSRGCDHHSSCERRPAEPLGCRRGRRPTTSARRLRGHVRGAVATLISVLGWSDGGSLGRLRLLVPHCWPMSRCASPAATESQVLARSSRRGHAPSRAADSATTRRVAVVVADWPRWRSRAQSRS